MRIEKINDFRQFLSLRDEWNSLLARCAHSCVSMTHEWLSCWWEAFGNGAELCVLLLREGEALRGGVPLMMTRSRFRGLPARTLALMVNGQTPEGGLLLTDPVSDSITCFIEFILEIKKEWDVLILKKLRRESKTTVSIQKFFENGNLSAVQQPSLSSPYIDMSEDWETYYASRSKKFRKVMRNKLNRVERDGTAVIEQISNVEDIRNRLDDVIRISSRSWKAQEGKSISDDPSVEHFYRKLTEIMGADGKVDLWLMRYNEEAIAFEYHLRDRNITYPIRADFDETYRELSPGSVLEYHILRALFENPEVCGYDSCGDTYDYLMKWATQVHEYVDFQIFNTNAYSKNLFRLESRVVPIARKTRELLRPRTVKATE